MNRLLEVGDKETRAFTDVEIEDHLLSFIGAGHETTARALSWLFYLLSQDTKSRDRFEAEVDTLDTEIIPPETWGDHLPFAMACFEETMRLFPPAPMIAREAINKDTIGDIIIPAGSILFLNTWLLHRHHTLWEAPDAFRPYRFMSDARNDIDRFQYLPFGVGAPGVHWPTLCDARSGYPYGFIGEKLPFRLCRQGSALAQNAHNGSSRKWHAYDGYAPIKIDDVETLAIAPLTR